MLETTTHPQKRDASRMEVMAEKWPRQGAMNLQVKERLPNAAGNKTTKPQRETLLAGT